jgi:hypothetical protein
MAVSTSSGVELLMESLRQAFSGKISFDIWKPGLAFRKVPRVRMGAGRDKNGRIP